MDIQGSYGGFRTSWDRLNIRGKETNIMVKIHTWNDVTNISTGEIISKVIECKDAKSYSNLIQFKKYIITCSEADSKRIIRPSKCELIHESEEENSAIQDIITQYKSDFIFKENAIENLSKYSQKALINYVLSIVDKAKEKLNK